MISAQRFVATDLDGTLFSSKHACSAANLAALRMLGERGVIRVIATGRSIYSAKKVLPPDMPIDYLVFSSGAGVMEWPTQQMLRAAHLSAENIRQTAQVFIEHQVDFMVHAPIPDNHYFWYHATQRENPDFLRRLNWYREMARPFDDSVWGLERACQFVAIEPAASGLAMYERVRPHLEPLTVIRATSPFDGESFWLEIFPNGVSKAAACEWIAQRHQINQRATLAIGNDYNDLALLAWGGTSYVVANAPPDLHAMYPAVASNDADGFSEAINLWIRY